MVRADVRCHAGCFTLPARRNHGKRGGTCSSLSPDNMQPTINYEHCDEIPSTKEETGSSSRINSQTSETTTLRLAWHTHGNEGRTTASWSSRSTTPSEPNEPYLLAISEQKVHHALMASLGSPVHRRRACSGTVPAQPNYCRQVPLASLTDHVVEVG